MARQEDACWRCGAPWSDAEPRPLSLHSALTIRGGLTVIPARGPVELDHAVGQAVP
jgi:hypothetical protein